ncbi:MAG: Ribosomal L29 protein [Candidatus Magasanikbacteria bacterium]|nr:Ribosomal L29 protein [Candidatus Magasanikbacteria bacterium]
MKELREKSEAELQRILADSRRSVLELKLKSMQGQMKRSHQYRDAKKTVAQALTILKANIKHKT